MSLTAKDRRKSCITNTNTETRKLSVKSNEIRRNSSEKLTSNETSDVKKKSDYPVAGRNHRRSDADLHDKSNNTSKLIFYCKENLLQLLANLTYVNVRILLVLLLYFEQHRIQKHSAMETDEEEIIYKRLDENLRSHKLKRLYKRKSIMETNLITPVFDFYLSKYEFYLKFFLLFQDQLVRIMLSIDSNNSLNNVFNNA